MYGEGVLVRLLSFHYGHGSSVESSGRFAPGLVLRVVRGVDGVQLITRRCFHHFEGTLVRYCVVGGPMVVVDGFRGSPLG